MRCGIDSGIWLAETDNTEDDIWLALRPTIRGHRSYGEQREKEKGGIIFSSGSHRDKNKKKMSKSFMSRQDDQSHESFKKHRVSPSVTVSAAQRVAGTRKHEMCYWSKFPTPPAHRAVDREMWTTAAQLPLPKPLTDRSSEAKQ